MSVLARGGPPDVRRWPARARRSRGAALAVALATTLPLAGACEVPDPRAGPGHVEPVSDEVAFRLLGPSDAALIVPVHINGEGPFVFVFEPGATLTCVFRSIVDVFVMV